MKFPNFSKTCNHFIYSSNEAMVDQAAGRGVFIMNIGGPWGNGEQVWEIEYGGEKEFLQEIIINKYFNKTKHALTKKGLDIAIPIHYLKC